MDTRQFFKVFHACIFFGATSMHSVYAADSLTCEDLKASWVEKIGEGWQPVLNSPTQSSISFPIPEGLDSASYLRITSISEVDVWMNGRLAEMDVKQWPYPVRQIYEENPEARVFIQLTSEAGFHDIQTGICTPSKGSTPRVESLMKKRTESGFQNTTLVAIVLIMIFMGLFRRYFPIRFSQIAKWTPKLRRAESDETPGGVLTLDNLTTMMMTSALATTVWAHHHVYSRPQDDFLALSVGYTALIVAATCLGKWLIVKFFSSVFHFRSLYEIHYVEILNYSCAVFMASFVLLLLDLTFWSYSHWLILNGLPIFFITVILFFQPWIYLKLSRMLPDSKILIISYLCISEFLPGFLLLIWILR